MLPFAEFARRTPYEVRFIEFMPLDADHAWTPDQVLTGAEIRDAIDAVYPLEPEPREPSATARVYRFADGRGKIGFINPVSEPFCGDCNRDPPDRRRAAAHVPVLAQRDRPARSAARRRRRPRARADHPRRGVAQGAQAPRRRARLHPAGADACPRSAVDRPSLWRAAVNSFASFSAASSRAQMLLLMLFALVAGAGTAITPCVLPVVPALLSASAVGGRRRPLGIVLGLALHVHDRDRRAGAAGQGRRPRERGRADAGGDRADRVRPRAADPGARGARPGAAVATGALRPQDARRRLLVRARRSAARSGSCARRAPGRSSRR